MIFSVIIPTYRRIDKLRSCLEALLAQDFSADDYEIIVVEDERGQEVSRVIEELKLRFKNLLYLSQDHRGPGAARNLGVAKAKGEVIAFTDDDCVVPKSWLNHLDAGFKRYPKVAGAGGYMEAPAAALKQNVFAQYESYVTHQIYGAGKKEILGGFEVPTGGTNNIAYRKKVLEEVGGFDESFPVAAGEDADLKKRICDHGHQILYLPLKVEHFHVTSWRGFLVQSWRRGIGSVYFHRKHGGGWDRGELLKNLFLLPKVFWGDVMVQQVPFRVAVLKKFASFCDYLAQFACK